MALGAPDGSRGRRIVPRKDEPLASDSLILPSEMAWSLRSSLSARGVLVETIDYKTRFFVPTGAREKEIFLDLVGQTPLAA
jgi:hypothetical protein